MSAPHADSTTAPNWARELLYTAAEQLALSDSVRCVFVAPGADGCSESWVASLRFDLTTTTAATYVHHKASGRFVVSSQPANVDEVFTWSGDYRHFNSHGL